VLVQGQGLGSGKVQGQGLGLGLGLGLGQGLGVRGPRLAGTQRGLRSGCGACSRGCWFLWSPFCRRTETGGVSSGSLGRGGRTCNALKNRTLPRLRVERKESASAEGKSKGQGQGQGRRGRGRGEGQGQGQGKGQGQSMSKGAEERPSQHRWSEARYLPEFDIHLLPFATL